MTQHGTSNDPRLDWLHDKQEQAYQLLTGHLEGNHPHWRGRRDGRWVVIDEDEAIVQARAGVPTVQDATRPLAAEDGE